jgi:hypothetical protein
MNYLHLLLIVVIGFLPPISVAGENDPVPILSFADTSCGAWTRSQQDEVMRQMYLFWFRGFVSGYNYGSETKQVPLNAMPDQDRLSLCIDKYCREHPLLPFTGAAFQLIKELRVRK